MKTQGLRVYVVSPSKPSDFMNRLYEHHAEAIWDRLTGYYANKLTDILQNENAFASLIRAFFQE
jgi:hypothetical protein